MRLSNYKSIAACDVELARLTYIVGRNGSGKRNFLDALRFVSDALTLSLDSAVESRGGIAEIRRRSKTRPYDVTIELNLTLGDGSDAQYVLTLGSTGDKVQVKKRAVQSQHG
ncbi:MAG: AAA family ATPase [Terriglobales bacterium]